MRTKRELVMYSRSTGCPFVTLAKRVLDEHGLTYHEVMIDLDHVARERVLDWTGYLSVPTLVIAHEGDVLPYATPDPIDKSRSPRGINRGSMITEPNIHQLIAWLQQHELIQPQGVGS
jgi:glutaredoxin